MRVAIGIEHNGEGFAPITLTGKEPVAQFVGNSGFATALLCEPRVHCRLCIGHRVVLRKRNAVVARVHVSAIANVSIWPFTAVERGFNAGSGKPFGCWLLSGNYGKLVRASKCKVALVA